MTEEEEIQIIQEDCETPWQRMNAQYVWVMRNYLRSTNIDIKNLNMQEIVDLAKETCKRRTL